MRPSLQALKTIKPRLPEAPAATFTIPLLDSITAKDLPNENFGKGNYYIQRTKFGHWPVYKKVQNTKVTTEVKRIQGDIVKFKQDLIKIAKLSPRNVTVNPIAGYINVKGDEVDRLKEIFDKHL